MLRNAAEDAKVEEASGSGAFIAFESEAFLFVGRNVKV